MIDKNTLLKIAALAHLNVPEAEQDAMVKALNSIFENIESLQKLDVSGVQPMSHAQSLVNVFRDDVLEPSLPIEGLMQNAPDTSGRYIRVPIIVEPGSEH
jgi:aspartyl-tRNA(Asn)/glutamyl-tRNA(Gln) amidotransferase subunit C